MNNKKNLITSLIYQLSVIISGLILPRLLISTFGSEINGLVASITQFLSFISLFEGGVGAAVLAELYLPIEKKDNKLISNILCACNNFFKKLSISFIIYTIFLMIFYPFFISNKLSFEFVSSLIFILSINILMQYMFSITNRLLLQADQRIYIPNILSTITVFLNLILTIIIINFFPSIHIVKIGSSVAFLIQPLFYDWYVSEKYKLDKIKKTNYVLKNRKDAFAQNLAHFINMNTDVILISTFLSLTDVSIYTVYMLALNALRNIVSTAANSYQAAIGKYIAQNDLKKLQKKYYEFETIIWMVCIVLFTTCMLLINQFVGLYTKGIEDAVYYQPVFAIIMCLAQFVYCIREPYRLLILSAGKFKETNFGSYMEAIINIVISASLISFLGLTGVAIGTFVAITYRFFYFIFFLRENIVFIKIERLIGKIINIVVIFFINIIVYFNLNILIKSALDFIIYGIIIIFSEFILFCIIKIVIHIFLRLYKYILYKTQ